MKYHTKWESDKNQETVHTVDSKIDENRCKQKYDLIQVMGDLYRYTYL